MARVTKLFLTYKNGNMDPVRSNSLTMFIQWCQVQGWVFWIQIHGSAVLYIGVVLTVVCEHRGLSGMNDHE